MQRTQLSMLCWGSDLQNCEIINVLFIVTELEVIFSSCPRTQMHWVMVATCEPDRERGERAADPAGQGRRPSPPCRRAPRGGRSPAGKGSSSSSSTAWRRWRHSSRPERVEGWGPSRVEDGERELKVLGQARSSVSLQKPQRRGLAGRCNCGS